MNSWIEIYRILWKQYFIKFRIWILFLILGTGLMGIISQAKSSEEEYEGIFVGVCAEDEKGFELLDKLEEEEGIFRFLGYLNEQDMIREIENGTLECGYMLPEGFYDQILKGKTTRQITLYYSPASAAHKISYEVVFANLFEILSEDILKTYLKEEEFYEWKEARQAKERLLALNAQYAGDDSTFHFVYETTGGKPDEKPENLNTLRGCIAVIIFFMSLLGLGNCMDQRNTWNAMQKNTGRRLESGSIHVAVGGSILFGGICLILCRTGGNFLQEAEGLFLYFIVLEIYIRVLGLIIKNSKVLYGLVPVVLLGCCVFCPVFIRIERYLPGAEWIARIFPVTYYLNIFLG